MNSADNKIAAIKGFENQDRWFTYRQQFQNASMTLLGSGHERPLRKVGRKVVENPKKLDFHHPSTSCPFY